MFSANYLTLLEKIFFKPIPKDKACFLSYSCRDAEVTVSLPLVSKLSTKWSVVGIAEVVVEEFLMKPLHALNSASTTAELYRLKRKLMDSPFNRESLDFI